MKRIALIVMAAFPNIALAEIDACAAITSDTDRLACYDTATGRTPTPDSPTGENWTVESTKSTFTDQRDVYIWTSTETALNCSYGQTPRLYVRCLEGETSYFVNHGCYAPASNRNQNTIQVEIRSDTDPASNEAISVSTDSKAFGYWSTTRALTQIRNNLLDRDQVAFRFQPYNDPPEIMRFNVRGLREAVATTNPSCIWVSLQN